MLMQKLARRLFPVLAALPMLGLGCLPDASQIRDQALNSAEGFVNGLLGVLVNNLFAGLGG